MKGWVRRGLKISYRIWLYGGCWFWYFWVLEEVDFGDKSLIGVCLRENRRWEVEVIKIEFLWEDLLLVGIRISNWREIMIILILNKFVSVK